MAETLQQRLDTLLKHLDRSDWIEVDRCNLHAAPIADDIRILMRLAGMGDPVRQPVAVLMVDCENGFTEEVAEKVAAKFQEMAAAARVSYGRT